MGSDGGIEGVGMVDSKASYNFVSQQLVNKWSLSAEVTIPYWLKIGNGQRIKTSGVCRKLQFS